MKTLDEVIKALRCTDPAVDQETKCNDCPYKESHRNELWYVGPSCLDEMFADVRHYLKEYKIKRMMIFTRIQACDNREQRLQEEIARYQEAVRNCEEAELKYRKLAQDLGEVGNPALTWEQLKKQDEQPIWVEVYHGERAWFLVFVDPDDDEKIFGIDAYGTKRQFNKNLWANGTVKGYRNGRAQNAE